MAVPKREKPTMPKIKITETVRSNLLKRPFKRAVADDSDIAGFALRVGQQRAHWTVNFTPHGLAPNGKRWGSTRLYLGDAMAMPVWEARAAALAARARVMAGGDPHREKLAQRASLTAQRGILPQTAQQALDLYVQAIHATRERSETTKKQSVHYVTKAIRLLGAETLPLAAIDASMIRLMNDTMPGSQFERRHVYRGAGRFLAWCRRRGLIERNPVDDIDPSERPRSGRSRDNTPSLSVLRSVRNVVEDEFQRDLVRFILLVPLRREEAAGLRWTEVDLDQGRIRISAERMKNRTVHELPLSEPALDILRSRQANGGELVFATAEGAVFASWSRLLSRIRQRIGQANVAKSEMFGFHDVRRSFVSILAERGLDVDLLDQCLSHSRKGVLGVYQRSARMSDRAAALKLWAALLLDETPNTNVLPFAQRVNDR
jgi:integrase